MYIYVDNANESFVICAAEGYGWEGSVVTIICFAVL